MAQDLSSTTPGKTAGLYYSTGASFASPTWVLAAGVQDLTMEDARADSNTTAKGDDIATCDVAYRNVTMSFKLVYILGSAFLVSLAAKYAARSPIQLLTLNGLAATTGATGINADWHIIKLSKSEPLEGNVTYDVELKPAKTTNAPAAYTVP